QDQRLGRLRHRVELLQAPAQRVFSAFAFADVAGDQRRSSQASGNVENRGKTGKNRDARAAAMAKFSFENRELLFLTHPQALLGIVGTPLWRQYLVQRLAEDLAGAEAEQPFRTAVP